MVAPNGSAAAPPPIGSANMTLARTSRYLTVADQLYQLASGAVTSDELVRQALHEIDASQPHLNAFRMVLAGSALAEAADADRRRAAGEHAPLLGVPIAVKDDVDVAGVPTHSGPAGMWPSAAADAEVVRRLRAAGAVIVGKTNTCEFGQWPFTSGPGFGHTRNPWARNHTPGGSSGGSAAAVAAGLVAAAIGSDGAGSVRIPAAWTNLVGIKPQRGRISTWPLAEAFNGITVYGVLARTVADAAVVLDAVAGNVAGDLHRPPPVSLSRIRRHGARPAAHRGVHRGSRSRASAPGWTPRSAPPSATVAERLADSGHTVMARQSRLRAAAVVELPVPVDVGPGRTGRTGSAAASTLDARTRANIRSGPAAVRSRCCAGPARTRQARSAGSAAIFDPADVVLAPTTAQPPPNVERVRRPRRHRPPTAP